MRIVSYSDLHLEFGVGFKPPDESCADVMVLAGDIITFDNFELLDSVLKAWQKHVLYVAGNHEYYTRKPMAEEAIKFQDWIAEHHPNVIFLQDEEITIDGVHFFGGTMWTDFNNRNFGSMRMAQRRMNDYRMIKIDKKHRLLPEATVELHKSFKDKLIKWFEKPLDGPRVVISHHVPIQSTNPIYRESHMNPAYISLDMEQVIMDYQPAIWVYGHSHEADDRMIGKTRVISNPRGYPLDKGKFECDQFDENGILIHI